jgi:hypothetical protein
MKNRITLADPADDVHPQDIDIPIDEVFVDIAACYKVMIPA